MVFSSISFLTFFLPCLFACYFVIPRKFRSARNGVLLVFSLVFYACGGPKFLLLMLLSIAVNYICGLFASAQHTRPVRLAGMMSAIIIGIGLLGYFKYAGFFAEIINSMGVMVPVPEITLPIGISFYTFQGLSYVIDVYRNDARVQRNPFKIALYIALFPQLVAGPIVRYTTVETEISERRESIEEVSAGIVRFLFGLAKKMILANSMGEIADAAFSQSAGDLSVAFAWLGALAYTGQIYFDFSAYSDMAIGMGLMIGFHYKENFNYPYLSSTVSEFWRRWHISLGSFFRDYVYIPLGGSRKGLGRTILNLFVVWALTGLWHGASWNFVLWGLYFFIFIALERLFLNKVFARLPGFVSHIYLLIVVYFGWILFRFKNMALIGVVLKGMFCQNGNPWTTFEANTTLLNYIFFLAIAVIAVTPVVHNIGRAISVASGRSAAWFRVNSVVQVAMPLVLLLISTMSLVGNSYNPFLYFQF